MTIKSVFYRESSFVKHVAWDEDSESLFIKFTSGTTWVYFDIPRNVYTELISSTSVGQYFNINIRNKYSSQRINYPFPSEDQNVEEKVQTKTQE